MKSFVAHCESLISCCLNFLKGMPLLFLLTSRYFYELDRFDGQYQISKIKENSEMIVKNAAK